MSADPKGFELVNPMDQDGNLRSGFSIIESINPYSYCSNNPMMYIDPSGFDDIIISDYNQIITERDITGDKQNDPMENSTETADFEDHENWDSSSPGVDLISKDKDVSSTHDGLLSYKDSGDSGYGFHATLTYKDNDGEYQTETYAHLKKPENADELISQGEVYVDAGTVMGEMSNTGKVWSTAGGTQTLGPVNDTQRAQGWGSHLHWDKRGQISGFTNPYQD
jgi:hypothetical protein